MISSRLHRRFIRASRAAGTLADMKLRLLHVPLARQIPEPARALRLARMLIPLCVFVGLFAEPFARWLVSFLSALPLPFAL